MASSMPRFFSQGLTQQTRACSGRAPVETLRQSIPPILTGVKPEDCCSLNYGCDDRMLRPLPRRDPALRSMKSAPNIPELMTGMSGPFAALSSQRAAVTVATFSRPFQQP
jgi:hypothetical protein